MEKNTIKKYAVWARTELISRVAQKAQYYGIEENKPMQYDAENIGDEVLTPQQKQQRRALILRIEEKGYQQVMEEVAYTWFNRFCALRYMEVNNYLPSHVRVFTNEENEFKPQILTEAIHLELDGLDMEKVYAYKESNDNEALYKYLLTVQCNALGSILPGMFRKISGYAELLFPDKLLLEGSVIDRMLEIPEEDWTDQVQIIGWLYQYYNSEPKDKVFANLKKNIKVSKENIPAATQLFTPDWIVRYMVENSLGRLWAEGHGKPKGAEWRYYLEEAEQEAEVQARLDEIRRAYRNLTPEDIRCIDPCMGSGHILCYMFDVLMQIYNEYGYPAHEAVESIIMNNLYGLELDKRAAQLAYFAVMMKARQYDRRFFSREIQPHTMHFQNLHVNAELLPEGILREMAQVFADADEFGSLLDVSTLDADAAAEAEDAFEEDMFSEGVREKLQKMVTLTRMLQMKYDVVCTNPPYMGSSGMNARLSDFVKKEYPDSKSDLFAVSIERGMSMTKPCGYNCMVTMQSWMFLSSYEKLREKLMTINTITNLMHMENMVMGIAFGTAVTVFRKSAIGGFKGTYNHITLPNIIVDVDGMEKPVEFPVSGNRFAQVSTENFSKIPGSPVAYWVSESFVRAFEKQTLADIAQARKGLDTGKNDLFLRMWHEADINNIMFNAANSDIALSSKMRWFPCTKGGAFRRWYGNNDYVVDWQNNGSRIKNFKGSYVRNEKLYFKKSMSWSTLTSGNISLRYQPEGSLFESKGSKCFSNDDSYFLYILGLLNSCVIQYTLSFLAPTLDYHEGPLSRVPVIVKENTIVDSLVEECVDICKSDWDSFENSWDFKRHPLI